VSHRNEGRRRRLRRSLIAPLAATALLAPTAAHAATFCADGATGCVGTPAASVQAALDAAAALPGPDRVEIGSTGSDAPEGFTIASGNVVDVAGVAHAHRWVDAAHQIVVDEPGATVEDLDLALSDTGSAAPIDIRRGTFARRRSTSAAERSRIRPSGAPRGARASGSATGRSAT
jgi:hypothetical protein